MPIKGPYPSLTFRPDELDDECFYACTLTNPLRQWAYSIRSARELLTLAKAWEIAGVSVFIQPVEWLEPAIGVLAEVLVC